MVLAWSRWTLVVTLTGPPGGPRQASSGARARGVIWPPRLSYVATRDNPLRYERIMHTILNLGAGLSNAALAARWLLLLAAWTPLAGMAQDAARILVVNSHASAPYVRYVAESRRTLQHNAPLAVALTQVSAAQLIKDYPAADAAGYDLVVALGTQAAQALQYWKPRSPVLYTLITQATFDSLRRAGRLACPEGLCTAVYRDQPLPRLMDILTDAFGEHRRPGVLLGPSSRALRENLEAWGEARGLEVKTAYANTQQELLPALKQLLAHSDVLISLPDPEIYNRHTTKSVLLTAYRYRVPVLAYSKAYADAGAALSVYSTPEQIARQCTRIINDFLQDGKRTLPAPQHPQQFTLRINAHAGRSLGLDLQHNPKLGHYLQETDDETADDSE